MSEVIKRAPSDQLRHIASSEPPPTTRGQSNQPFVQFSKMAAKTVGRVLSPQGPLISSISGTSSVLNSFARNAPQHICVTSRCASTTVFQPTKLGQQPKPISEGLGRNLSANPEFALNDADDDLMIDMKTDVPGRMAILNTSAL